MLCKAWNIKFDCDIIRSEVITITSPLHNKSFDFSTQIVLFLKCFLKRKNTIIAKQLLRSATSIGVRTKQFTKTAKQTLYLNYTFLSNITSIINYRFKVFCKTAEIIFSIFLIPQTLESTTFSRVFTLSKCRSIFLNSALMVPKSLKIGKNLRKAVNRNSRYRATATFFAYLLCFRHLQGCLLKTSHWFFF